MRLRWRMGIAIEPARAAILLERGEGVYAKSGIIQAFAHAGRGKIQMFRRNVQLLRKDGHIAGNSGLGQQLK